MNKLIDQEIFNKTGIKQVGLVVATVLLASLLSACGGGSSSAPADTGGDTANTTGDTTGDTTGGTAALDADNDGTPDATDNCPAVANADQADADTDGVGDACDTTPTGDTDGDGVDNGTDNCPAVANADQADADSDNIGDACEAATPPTIVSGFTLLKADGGNAASIAEAACVQKGGLTWQMPMAKYNDGNIVVYQYGDTTLDLDDNASRDKVTSYVAGFGSLCGLNNGWRLPTAAELESTMLVDGATGAVMQDVTTSYVFDSSVFTDTVQISTVGAGYIPVCTNQQNVGIRLSRWNVLPAEQEFDPGTEVGWTADTYPCFVRMVNGTLVP
ncbi:MAG: thrombospondin type 3 repeat-containing protein [Gammaproteobacteria bacterium]|nr:thrombospondin type 3 repeat-containing protein [Gammaproteobacteria bacterium]